MEFSPYLQAIQKVAGQTIGEKKKTLHYIGKKIIDNCENPDEFIEVYPSEELPEALIPLVKLEIARLLRKPEGIVDALKSDDQTVFDRALRIKWFSNGSVENCLNAQLFQNHILPYISLNRRFKFIKILAINLTANQLSTTAEEFYLSLSEMYGNRQAQPLLKACSEPFIWNTIIDRQIVLSNIEVKYLFSKYPALIVKYMQLGIHIYDNSNRNLHQVSLDQYKLFLPKLLKHYSKELVDLIKVTQHTFDIKLNAHYTNIFLENEIEEFLKNPKLFFRMLSLKTVTEKLSKAQFEIYFESFFPKTIDKYVHQNIFIHLEFLPDHEKLKLLVSTFKKVYGKDWFECHDLMVPELMAFMPPEERIKQARIYLETYKEWHFSWSKEKFLRCYLPVEESIPLIKEKLAKAKECYDRGALLQQLIYTCKVNNDKIALLEVLKFIATRHKNEQFWISTQLLSQLSEDFELELLSTEHWDVLFNFLKYLQNKNSLINNIDASLKVIASGIHFDFLNNQPIIEKINLYTEVNIMGDSSGWNILQTIPKYERQCLEEFAKVIPTIYPKISKEFASLWSKVVYSFIDAIHQFNGRNAKNQDQLENVSIKNYPWLLDAIEKLIREKPQGIETEYVDKLKSLLKLKEQDFYNLWVSEAEQQLAIGINKALVILKRNPQQILDHWQIYYEKCKEKICWKSGQRFLKVCRWYQDIPLKFLEMSIKEVEESNDSRAMVMLAILLEGSELEEFLTSCALKSFLADVAKDDTKVSQMLESSIPEAASLANPPLSLDFILRLSEGDHIRIVFKSLINVRRRVAIRKLLPFCQDLMNQKVSLKKHGIRLFRDIASATQLRNTLMHLWRKEKNESIRLLIVRNIKDAFVFQPCSQTWEMMNECFDSLTTDDRDTLEILECIDKIPNEYVQDYVKKLFVIFKKIGNPDEPMEPQGNWYHIKKLIENIPVQVANLFSEDFHEEILNSYLADSSIPRRVPIAAQWYIVSRYIAPAKDKIDYRLKIFSKIYAKIIEDNSNDDIISDPASNLLFGLMEHIVFDVEHSSNRIKFIDAALDSFLSVSKPQLAPEFYCNLTLAALYDDKVSPKMFAAQLVKILPSLIDIFSVGFISAISKIMFNLASHFYHDIKDEALLDIIEFLLELDDDYAIYVGATLLVCCERMSGNRFKQLVYSLRKHKHPLVIANAYMIINGIFRQY